MIATISLCIWAAALGLALSSEENTRWWPGHSPCPGDAPSKTCVQCSVTSVLRGTSPEGLGTPRREPPKPCQQRPLGGGGRGVGPLVLKGAEWSRQVKGHWLSGILSLMLPGEWLSNLFWAAASSKKYVLHHKPGHTYV